MEVVPRNTIERIFTVVVLIFSLLVFSSFVGTVTNSMTALRAMSGDDSKRFWVLRKYLSQNRLNKNLSNRIVKYLEHTNREQGERVQKESVVLLRLLSEPLH